MRDAAQEVVLLGIEGHESRVLLLHAREELGVAEGDGDAGGEELEQVLVGRLPAHRRRGMAEEDAGHLAAAEEVGADGPRLARDALLDLDCVGVAEDDPGVDQAQGLAGVGGRALEQHRGPVGGRPGGDRLDRPGHLAVASGEVRRQLLLALGEPAQLVVGQVRQRLHPLAGRDPLESRLERPKRPHDDADQEAAHDEADEGGDDEDDQHESGGPGAPAGDEQETEEADRQERGNHDRGRDPHAEAAAAHVGSTSRR